MVSLKHHDVDKPPSKRMAAKPMSLSFARIRSLLAAHGDIRHWLVGYSGGADSHVLLHLLARHRHDLQGQTLTAVYIDHGLHPASDQWAQHCEKVCQELGVAFQTLRVAAGPPPGESPEAVARRARYRALESLLGMHHALLTAHHQDDQAETLLLQLLRGAGPHGLAAMPTANSLGRGLLLRPFLDVTRAEILAYAKQQDLQWIEDTSNTDFRFDRNYLRHSVIPLLKARWPSVNRSLSRAACHCAEATLLLDVLADQDLQQAASEHLDCLNVAALRRLDEHRQRNALRRWFQHLQLPLPATTHLSLVLREIMTPARDRQPLIRWAGCEVRRYREHLYAMVPLPSHDPARIFSLRPETPNLYIPSIGQVTLQITRGEGLHAAALAGQPLTIRFRRGGERFRLQGRSQRQALKKLLQEVGVPPWERERLPLLYCGEQLAAVARLGVSADFAACPQQEGIILTWQKTAAFDNV
jgi:tRNA(Ile)-lysidine synthase